MPKSTDILIVDYQTAILNYVQELLQHAGFHTFCCTNPESAMLFLLFNPHLPLILANSHLPGSSGLQLLSYVKWHYPSTRRLIMTALPLNIPGNLAHGCIDKTCLDRDLLALVNQQLAPRPRGLISFSAPFFT
jgi:DNA-binding NtrC family response regulator